MIILYPTETVYALGVNAFDAEAVEKLFALKERERDKTVSVLVRGMEDVERWAVVPPKAQLLAAEFLPGALTLVLRARDFVPRHLLASDGTLGFRISSDSVAAELINEFMTKHDAPLTCTSANKSRLPTLPTPKEILGQFGQEATLIGKVYDDGTRHGVPSTIVRVVGEKVEVLRVGSLADVIYRAW